MGDDVMSQSDAWSVFDRWLDDERVSFLNEPPGLERRFRGFSRSRQASPKAWADAYLAAFAETALVTPVTFDGAFRRKPASLILLAE